MNYGVMTTPALVIDGKVVVKGRVPSAEEIRKLITK
jgi:protein-disulfide isomerase